MSTYTVVLYDGDSIIDRIHGLTRLAATRIGEQHIMSASDEDEDDDGPYFSVIPE